MGCQSPVSRVTIPATPAPSSGFLDAWRLATVQADIGGDVCLSPLDWMAVERYVGESVRYYDAIEILREE